MEGLSPCPPQPGVLRKFMPQVTNPPPAPLPPPTLFFAGDLCDNGGGDEQTRCFWPTSGSRSRSPRGKGNRASSSGPAALRCGRGARRHFLSSWGTFVGGPFSF